MATGGNAEFSSSGSGSTGLQPNVAAALSYVLGIVSGVVFVLIEKDPFVRFHAFQSIFLSVAWIAIWIVLSIIGAVLGHIPILNILAFLVGILISIGLSLGGLLLWIVLIVRAFQGARLSLPYVGPLAEQYAAKPIP
jgi:uncharacterized membrane protein